VKEAYELFQVLEARLRLRAAVALPHGGIAGFIEDQLGERGVPKGRGAQPPALEGGDEIAERPARLAGQLLRLDDLARRLEQRNRARPGELVDAAERGVAKSALGHVENALEFEIVGGVANDLEIGDGILDLLALVEARTTDHAVGQGER